MASSDATAQCLAFYILYFPGLSVYYIRLTKIKVKNSVCARRERGVGALTLQLHGYSTVSHYVSYISITVIGGACIYHRSGFNPPISC